MTQLLGKCPPDREQFRALADAGFDGFELYLDCEHLDRFDTTLQTCRETPHEIAVVHTPHVTLEEPEYFAAAGRLAGRLGAYLLIHSSPIGLEATVAAVPAEPPATAYGYENGPDNTTAAIETHILGSPAGLVLDVAHLYLAAPNQFDEAFAHLTDSYADRIDHVHLCDATAEDDHRQLGAGEIPLETVVDWIETAYDGTVTLELMSDRQPTAYDRFSDIAARV